MGNQLVDRIIKENRVAVFSKSYCPYCKKAKATLTQHYDPSKIIVVELDQRDDGDSIQQYLAQLTGAKSVPRVFIDGECIGGGDETVALAQSGKLDMMLREKQAA